MWQKAAALPERQGHRRPERRQRRLVPLGCRFFESRAWTGNSSRDRALWAGMKTRGGDGASKASADNMIEQTQMDQRRKGDPALDEARLRQQAIGVKLRQ